MGRGKLKQVRLAQKVQELNDRQEALARIERGQAYERQVLANMRARIDERLPAARREGVERGVIGLLLIEAGIAGLVVATMKLFG